jgi:hypothetical protein
MSQDKLMIDVNDCLLRGMRNAVKEATDRIIQEAKDKLDKEIRIIVGNLALNISDYFSVDRFGGDIRITVLHHKGGYK